MEGWPSSQWLSLWWDEDLPLSLCISLKHITSLNTHCSLQSALIFKDVKIRGFWVTQWKKDHSAGESSWRHFKKTVCGLLKIKMVTMRLCPQMQECFEACWMTCVTSSDGENWQLLPAQRWASGTTARLSTWPCSLSLQRNRSWSCEHKCLNWREDVCLTNLAFLVWTGFEGTQNSTWEIMRDTNTPLSYLLCVKCIFCNSRKSIHYFVSNWAIWKKANL